MSPKKPATIEEFIVELKLGKGKLAKLRLEHHDDDALLACLDDLWKWRRKQDEPRIPAKHSQFGYTASSYMGLPSEDGPEPEAIPESYQEEITLDARKRWASHIQETRADDAARRGARAASAGLRELAIEAAKAGVDPNFILADFQRWLDRQRATLKRAA